MQKITNPFSKESIWPVPIINGVSLKSKLPIYSIKKHYNKRS